MAKRANHLAIKLGQSTSFLPTHICHLSSSPCPLQIWQKSKRETRCKACQASKRWATSLQSSLPKTPKPRRRPHASLPAFPSPKAGLPLPLRTLIWYAAPGTHPRHRASNNMPSQSSLRLLQNLYLFIQARKMGKLALRPYCKLEFWRFGVSPSVCKLAFRRFGVSDFAILGVSRVE